MAEPQKRLSDLSPDAPNSGFSGNSGSSGAPPFTGRVEHIRSFVDALRTQRSDEHRVLVYHGIGGIGKSRLSRELEALLAGNSAKAAEMDLPADPAKLVDSAEHVPLCWGRLDFQEPQLRADAPLALFTMRGRLAERHGLRFPAFDLAYAEWWTKTNPNVPLAQSDLPFLEESDFLIECASIAQDIPGAGLITKIPKLIQKLGQKVQNYRLQQRMESLKRLSAMKANEIADYLPVFWAQDLQDEMAQRDRRVVLFLDTYEALRDGRRAENQRHRLDAWVREWVAQLPGVLWVVSGRDKLYWREVDNDWTGDLTHHLVGGLSEPDVRGLLTDSGITDTRLQGAIIATAKGVPYDCELALGIYREKQANGETPKPEDFTGTPQDLHKRFFRYLDDDGLVRALELLAVPRTWDRALYAVLADHFDPGFPVGQFNKLMRFAFVTRLEGGSYALHERTRETLWVHGSTDPADVHAFLFAHYEQRLSALDQPRDVTPAHERALTEAFYHGQHLMDLKSFADWLHPATQVFNYAARWRVLDTLYEDLLANQESKFGREHRALTTTLNNLAVLYKAQGRYEEAELLYQRALDIKEQVYVMDHLSVATTLNNLASLYEAQGRYEEAELHCQRALAFRKKSLGMDHPDVAASLNNLAGLHRLQGRYEKAESCYQRALALRRKTLGTCHPDVAVTLNNIAALYYEQGEYTEAELHYQRAIGISENTVGTNHPHFATALNNLAGLYKTQGHYKKAESLYLRSLRISEEALGMDHPDVASTLNNLAVVYKAQGCYEEAKSLYQRSLEILNKRFGSDHPHTRLAHTNYEKCKREQKKAI